MNTRIKPLNEGDVVINGVKYPIFVDPKRGLAWWREDGLDNQEGSSKKPVAAVWDRGWFGGMGEGKRIDPASVGHAYTENIDCTSYAFARLVERKYSSSELLGSNTNYPVYYAEDEDPDTTNSRIFVWELANNLLTKYGLAATTITTIYGKTITSGTAGRPAKFEGKWYFPFGDSVQFLEVTRINPELDSGFYYNGAAYTDRTAEAKSAAGTPFILLSGASDYFYWGALKTFNALQVDIATAAAGATMSLEYWNGAWTALAHTDGTSDFTVDGEITWTVPGDWATTAINGETLYWVRAVPSGALGTAPTANYARIMDQLTQSDAGLYAMDFATYQDGATAKLARSHGTNLVSLAAGTPLTAGSWAGGFEVGDTSAPITSLLDTGVTLFVAKEDNLYKFEMPGVAVPVFNILQGSGDSRNGTGLCAIPGTEMAIYPHQTGLYAIDSYQMHLNIGPDRNPLNIEIPNITGEPRRGRHLETTVVGQWIYSIYEVETSSTTDVIFVLAGKIGSSLRDITWYTFFIEDAAGDSYYMRGLYVDSHQRLWYYYAGQSHTRQLGTDGSPSPGGASNGRGAVSTTHRLFLPITDFGLPNTLKQLRVVEVKARGAGATCPIQVKVLRDGGSLESVGATIESAGLSKRYWTLGTNDTCYDAQIVLDITTTAGYSTASDPQIWGVTVRATPRPDHAGVYRAIIDTGARYKNTAFPPKDVKTQRDALVTLINAAPVTCVDPDGNSLTLTVAEVRDLEVRQDASGAVKYVLEVELSQFVNA